MGCERDYGWLRNALSTQLRACAEVSHGTPLEFIEIPTGPSLLESAYWTYCAFYHHSLFPFGTMATRENHRAIQSPTLIPTQTHPP